MIVKITDEQVLKMARLAILASVAVGMGVLHYDRDLRDEDIAVKIEPTGVFVDYYQGRMVKFRAWRRDDGQWEFPDTISNDESWIRMYPTYDSLYRAAGGVT